MFESCQRGWEWSLHWSPMMPTVVVEMSAWPSSFSSWFLSVISSLFSSVIFTVDFTVVVAIFVLQNIYTVVAVICFVVTLFNVVIFTIVALFLVFSYRCYYFFKYLFSNYFFWLLFLSLIFILFFFRYLTVSFLCSSMFVDVPFTFFYYLSHCSYINISYNLSCEILLFCICFFPDFFRFFFHLPISMKGISWRMTFRPPSGT